MKQCRMSTRWTTCLNANSLSEIICLIGIERLRKGGVYVHSWRVPGPGLLVKIPTTVQEQIQITPSQTTSVSGLIS